MPVSPWNQLSLFYDLCEYNFCVPFYFDYVITRMSSLCLFFVFFLTGLAYCLSFYSMPVSPWHHLSLVYDLCEYHFRLSYYFDEVITRLLCFVLFFVFINCVATPVVLCRDPGVATHMNNVVLVG